MVISCEKHKDPFSSKNSQPVIQAFYFIDNSDSIADSLKYKTEKIYKIKLNYSDSDKQNLSARFNFLSGSGGLCDWFECLAGTLAAIGRNTLLRQAHDVRPLFRSPLDHHKHVFNVPVFRRPRLADRTAAIPCV